MRPFLRPLLRPATIALMAVSALVFGGLYVAERTLLRSERENLASDAHESAAVISSFFAMRAEALSALHAFYMVDSVTPDTAEFNRLVGGMHSSGVDLRRVWLTDTAGRVVLQRNFGRDSVLIPDRLDIDTLSQLALGSTAALARRTGRPVVSRPGPLAGSDTGFVILEPLIVAGVFHGFAGGTVANGQLRELFAARRASTYRQGIGLFADSSRRDTVVVVSLPFDRARQLQETTAAVMLPSGDQWWVAVSSVTRSPVRLQLWLVAAAALGALGVGLWHERRQTLRIAERSQELEHLSQELLRANRAKSEFLANVSHELRTPLNAIVGFTELLRDGVYGELTPRQGAPVERIEASATHLRELVDQVLDLARMAAGRLEVHSEQLDLRQFVLDVATEVEPLMVEKGLAFSLVMGAGTPRIRTDPTHLRQILVNLLGNAVEFTSSGSITVRTQVVEADALATILREGAANLAAGGEGAHDAMAALVAADGSGGAGASGTATRTPAHSWVALHVSDTGTGIAAADQQRIFNEFEQVNAGSRGGAEPRGTGLGLPISRRLANLLGGDVTVRSEPEHGSTFTLWLPVR